MCKLYAYTKPFFIRDLAFLNFGISGGGVLETIPHRYRETTVYAGNSQLVPQAQTPVPNSRLTD